MSSAPRAMFTIAIHEAEEGRYWGGVAVEVRADGRALDVTLQGTAICAQFVFMRDPLLLHR